MQGWQDVAARPHGFAGTEYRFERREIGHVHGDSLVDNPFPKKVRNELVAAHRAEQLPILGSLVILNSFRVLAGRIQKLADNDPNQRPYDADKSG